MRYIKFSLLVLLFLGFCFGTYDLKLSFKGGVNVENIASIREEDGLFSIASALDESASMSLIKTGFNSILYDGNKSAVLIIRDQMLIHPTSLCDSIPDSAEASTEATVKLVQKSNTDEINEYQIAPALDKVKAEIFSNKHSLTSDEIVTVADHSREGGNHEQHMNEYRRVPLNYDVTGEFEGIKDGDIILIFVDGSEGSSFVPSPYLNSVLEEVFTHLNSTPVRAEEIEEAFDEIRRFQQSLHLAVVSVDAVALKNESDSRKRSASQEARSSNETLPKKRRKLEAPAKFTFADSMYQTLSTTNVASAWPIEVKCTEDKLMILLEGEIWASAQLVSSSSSTSSQHLSLSQSRGAVALLLRGSEIISFPDQKEQSNKLEPIILQLTKGPTTDNFIGGLQNNDVVILAMPLDDKIATSADKDVSLSKIEGLFWDIDEDSIEQVMKGFAEHYGKRMIAVAAILQNLVK